MKKKSARQMTVTLMEDDIQLSLAELCRASQLSAEAVMRLVEQGVIEPSGREPTEWRFSAISVGRVRCVYRLQNDLGVNIAGAALALELLDELESLRARMQRLENFL
jgi:chaperone modulatory protein CbpM